MISVLFLAKNSRTSLDVWAGAFLWCKICDWFFHNSVRCWRIASKNRRITWKQYCLLTVRPFGKNSLCITPLQSKKTVSKTFTFDRTWWAFFDFGRFWKLPLGWLSFGFNVTSYDPNLDDRWTSSTSPERCPCDVVFAQNRKAQQNRTNLLYLSKTNWQFKMADIVNIYRVRQIPFFCFRKCFKKLLNIFLKFLFYLYNPCG